MKEKLRYGYAVFSALFLFLGMTVTATADDARRLIQTVTEEDACMGMIHLGLLEAQTYEEGSVEKAMEAVKPSIVKIQVSGYYGSGTIFRITEEELVIVSSRHLLESGDLCRVTLYTQDIAAGTVFGISDRYDVGFVSVPLTELSYNAVMQLRHSAVDEQCYELLQEGDEMFTAGSADGVAENLYSGSILHTDWYIEEFDANMLYTYCNAKAGMSGGGTYDIHGHYIGMLTGGYGEETVSLPVSVITEAYGAAVAARGSEIE